VGGIYLKKGVAVDKTTNQECPAVEFVHRESKTRPKSNVLDRERLYVVRILFGTKSRINGPYAFPSHGADTKSDVDEILLALSGESA
jgi:hypothetical protein